MVYGYIRVSTDKQTVENQRFEINKFCKAEKSRYTSEYRKRPAARRRRRNGSWAVCSNLSRKVI